MDTVSEFHAEAPQAIARLAQGPYVAAVAARAGFEPTILRTKGDEFANELPELLRPIISVDKRKFGSYSVVVNIMELALMAMTVVLIKYMPNFVVFCSCIGVTRLSDSLFDDGWLTAMATEAFVNS